MDLARISGCEALTAGAGDNRVWIGDFEASGLEIVTEIELGTSDEKRTLGIGNHPDAI